MRRSIVDSQIPTALISGLVALVVAGATTAVAWVQIRREHRRQIAELKISWAIEVHKLRLETYPKALEAIAPLSKFHGTPDPTTLLRVAELLNDWLYPAGGLCGDTTTRAAVTALRRICVKWAEDRSATFRMAFMNSET
jgi:hypothetical protein